MEPLLIIAYIVLGIGAAILGASFGLGGGVVYVPVLYLLFDMNVKTAITISLACILISSTSATFEFFRQKRIDYRTAFTYAILAVIGSIIGTIIREAIDEKPLKIIFGGSLILIASYKTFVIVKSKNNKNKNNSNGSSGSTEEIEEATQVRSFPPLVLSPRHIVDNKGVEFKYSVDIYKGILGIFFGGMLAGMIGVGGGVIFVPVLLMCGFPIHLAVSTSTLLIVFTSTSSTITKIVGGGAFNVEAIIIIGIGAIIGSNIGARLIRRVKAMKLELGLWAIIFASGLSTILRTIYS
ncbi:MAG: sulfite exporter TauE/SafE family protein [Candidatus Kariarchaeaceae archaeon]